MPKATAFPLSVEEVVARCVTPVGTGSDRLTEALRYLDRMARRLAPQSALLETLNLDDQGEVEWFLALEFDASALRLRKLVERAYRRLAAFSDLAFVLQRRDADRTELERLASLLETRRDRAFRPAIAGLRESAQALAPKRRLEIRDPRLDLLGEVDTDGLTDEELSQAFSLIEIDETWMPRWNDEAADRCDDDDLKEDLKAALDRYSIGSIEIDDVSFFALQLGEIYALCFGETFPTWYHGDLDTGRDKDFLQFAEAAFGLVGGQLPSREGILRHWRPFTGVKHRLDRLASLGRAACNGDAPPFFLELQRDIPTVAILEDLEAFSSR